MVNSCRRLVTGGFGELLYPHIKCAKPVADVSCENASNAIKIDVKGLAPSKKVC
ncbi:hypothetical protein Psta_1568 [Pirellula staleyi DSM 6068]|uniref:Uncharacterized protein n=1 Tax=Pirellula staleyi (strain ATCC 27377 / DSM 6068 / ICPB 4128) TaxID=530564 RepID=D2QXQ8_PIRSD|nr:hypothetical protein Psta_1568 [Pirellula staleyi DSM 6068]